ILDQSFRDFEFIIIDDGSTDRTNEIIRHYARQDPRVKLITQKNQGLIAALNTGFKLAQGEYIARMDADDISLRNRLQEQYTYFEKHSELVLLGSLAAFIDESSHVTGIWPFLYGDHEIRSGMASHTQYCHGTVMIRRSVVSGKGEYYDPIAKHYEDYEYWPRLLKHGTGENLPKVLYYYRQSSTSITTTKKPEMEEGSRRIRERESGNIADTFGPKDCWAAFKTARTYRPSHIRLEGKSFPSKLRRNYQSYLIGQAKTYILKRDYFSALFALAASFCINPINFVSLGFGIAREVLGTKG
ncbi:glycosyltransferase, partial [Candidatus Saccharibacteria bacterium]